MSTGTSTPEQGISSGSTPGNTGKIKKPGSKRRRLIKRIVLGAVIVAVLVVAWLAWLSVTGAMAVKNGAASLTAAMSNGNQQQLDEAVDQISAGTQKLHTAAWSPPARIASFVPYFGDTVSNAQQLSEAGTDASRALEHLQPNLKAGIYRNKTVDLAALDALLTGLPDATSDFEHLSAALEKVDASGPGGAQIAEVRDQALAGAQLLTAASQQLPSRKAEVLDALGANGERNFLVPLLNDAQLRASGGAPLSAAIVSFNQGKLSVPFNGYIGREAYKGHVPIVYQSASPAPWGTGSEGLAFINSNAHPDWRMSGEDLMRAWNASQDRKVQGVFALDTKGIAAVLGATGSVDTEEYGTVDQDNFAQVVVKDAYANYTVDEQKTRQSVNDQIGQLVIDRLVSGNAPVAAQAIAALTSVAPGRHFQMYFANDQLEQAVQAMGLSGSIDTDSKADTAAVYSRNRNQSKTDIYSQRDLKMTVELQADGSAKVRQQLDVTNSDKSGEGKDLGEGYYTAVSANEWFFVLPPAAKDASLTAPKGYTKPTSNADGLGRSVLSTEGVIQPGESASLSIEYTLPAGTFTQADGSVEYTLITNPQPLENPVNLDVTVTYPDQLQCVADNPEWSSGDGSATLSLPMSTLARYSLSCAVSPAV